MKGFEQRVESIRCVRGLRQIPNYATQRHSKAMGGFACSWSDALQVRVSTSHFKSGINQGFLLAARWPSSIQNLPYAHN